ncbi:MAG TPA: hypothetical protein DCY31_05180 [Ruminococcaceae bacterium]|nr:hypothetical protein [Oscillospiraceae bacterium]
MNICRRRINHLLTPLSFVFSKNQLQKFLLKIIPHRFGIINSPTDKIITNHKTEVRKMKSTGSSVAKGIGVGMLVGGAMTLIGSSMMNSKKANYKKMAKKAIKSAESFMDSMM